MEQRRVKLDPAGGSEFAVVDQGKSAGAVKFLGHSEVIIDIQRQGEIFEI
jgi:hypothetical protein